MVSVSYTHLDVYKRQEYHTALKGQSWKLRLMNTIDECMKYARSEEHTSELQ